MTSERKFIEESVKRVLLKEYLKRKTERSGFGGLDIQRTPMGTRVTLIAERPGMVIGRKGETIKELTEYVENEFKFDNPQIEVKEVTNPNLNPHIMAQKLANALERGWHFRRAGHSTVRRIMGAGAKGCQVIISGKLTGQRHRTEKFREGHIKYCGETKLNWMLEGYAVAKKKLGIIGVKVQIMDPKAKLPDEIELMELKDVAEIKAIPEGITPEPVKDDESKDTVEAEPDLVEEDETEIEAEDKADSASQKEEGNSKSEDEEEVQDSKNKSENKKDDELAEPADAEPSEDEDKEKDGEVDIVNDLESEPEQKEVPMDTEPKTEVEAEVEVETDSTESDNTENDSVNDENDNEKSSETVGE